MSAVSTLVNFPGYRTGNWVIDPPHSDVGFVVRHMMVSKVRGRFLDIEGTITTAENPLESTATATIQMASISTGNERRDNHVRSNDFLDIATYPVMTFTSTGARIDGDDVVMDGDMTIRGVTKPITLAVEVGGFGRDSKGKLRMGFTATGTLSRQDFGVVWNAVLDEGGVALSDKVQLILEIAAILQED
jgi:polyisoprenoid-binding protein YceI